VGNIPEELYSMTSLINLVLTGNCRFTGTLSTRIGQLLDLNELYLTNNYLSGTIPSELGGLNQLKDAALAGNVRCIMCWVKVFHRNARISMPLYLFLLLFFACLFCCQNVSSLFSC
jgi:hypothetical protein